MNPLRKSEEQLRCGHEAVVGLVPHEIHDSDTANHPVQGQPDEHRFSDPVPFAIVHVRLFEDSAASVVGDSKHREYAQKEQLGYVLDGFEEVLNISRHKSFGFVDFARWAFSQVGLMFFGLFLGVLLGMRLQEIITSGVVQ